MKNFKWMLAGIFGLGVIVFAIFLPIGPRPALPQREGRPVPPLSQVSPRQPIADVRPGQVATTEPVISSQGAIASASLPVTLTDSQGKARTIDMKSPDAPGFIETKKGERYRVRLTWPHRDREVWATRMDGGSFDGENSANGMLLKIPATGRGEIDFGFVTGPESGRYQRRFVVLSGRNEPV